MAPPPQALAESSGPDRGTVLVGLVYVSLALRNRLPVPNATHDADKPSVLFVCVHNADFRWPPGYGDPLGR